jgi:hypothetical protein
VAPSNKLQGQGQGQGRGQGQGQGQNLRGQGQGQNLRGPYGQESGLRAGFRILIDFLIARGGLSTLLSGTEGVITYVDLMTYRRPQSLSLS